MDQSGPGRSPQQPLIIERPDLTHPLHRVLGIGVTLAAWAVWLLMWFWLAQAALAIVGLRLPGPMPPGTLSLSSFKALMNVAPLAALCMAAALALGVLRRWWVRRVMDRHAPVRLVGLDRLARDAALNPARVRAWHDEQILYVEHGPMGRVKDASAVPPAHPAV